MRLSKIKVTLRTALLAVATLLLGTGWTLAQTVSLTAGASTATLPDGSSVPMWGYTCTAASGATCSALNPNAGGGWSPVVITVPTGSTLTVNLTNSLQFAGAGIPTSLQIMGQIGGGLGGGGTSTTSPVHPTQTQATWSTVTAAPVPFTPPAQGPRVQSFGNEIAPGTSGPLTWANLRAGTYLIESGTHPSIQGPMGLYGILVVTNAPTATAGVESTAGTAYPSVSYDGEIPMLFSEIDPVQNRAVSTAVNTTGFTETAVWSGQPNGCGNPSSSTYNTCYPPAVNYKPLYYLINGVAFNRGAAGNSLFPVTPATLAPASGPGKILVRLVNAGLRMHVPSIVGAQTTSSVAGSPASYNGMALIAEDGNPLPGVPRVQSEVFMAAGKTYDVLINAPVAGSKALPIYARDLSLSANAVSRDAGMLAYISINGSGLPAVPSLAAAVAAADSYPVTPTQVLSITDPTKGVIANDINVFNVHVATAPAHGNLTFNADGTFTYVPCAAAGATPSCTTWTGDSFVYQANGTGPTATVTLTVATAESGSAITLANNSYTSNMATFIKIPPPGILMGASDSGGYPLSVALATITPQTGLTVTADSNGGFYATVATSGTYTFTFRAQNSQGVLSPSSSPATVSITFPTGNGPKVTVVDGKTLAALPSQDYRWIIEEDKSFFIDPNNITNSGTNIVPILGVNFHTSDMTFVAQGCTGEQSCETGQTMYDANPSSLTFGQHIPAVCDLGNGACRPGTSGKTAVTPDKVALDPTKRYYISVLPGDAANSFQAGTGGAVNGQQFNPANCTAATCGHSMGGAPIPPGGSQAVTVLVQQNPFPPAKLSVNVFEDDFPLNGEQDAGGGVDVLATNEPGLGGFNVILWDDMGGSGDVTGQMTYDMFNMPLSNSLDGYIDPATGQNACPITKAADGITGMIVTCPKYESDGVTLSPLAGQAVIANLMPGRFSVQAIPGADRIARGEEWLQTNTLDGQKAHDSFLRIGEPSYFQEFGPAGYHVSIGFANPKIINGRHAGVCAGTDINLQLPPGTSCSYTITGKITTSRMSRTPDERLFSSGSRDSFAFSQCYISFGDPDGEDFAFTKCNGDGTFTLTGLPPGDWRVTAFDQWNDQIVDGLSTPVGLGTSCGSSTNTTCAMGDIAVSQWQANLYTRTFLDTNKTGAWDGKEGGLALVPVSIRYRDGSLANNLTTDFEGVANFNETFPLFNWYVVETDVTRYKNTGTHVVYDAGGPADGSPSCGLTGYPACGTSTIGKFLANTNELISLPNDLRVPGAVYCTNADCTGFSIAGGLGQNPSCTYVPGTTTTPAAVNCTTALSTGRIDPAWVPAEGWQGFSGQNSFIEFGKVPYQPGENGGIHGHVVYASTRPFDDPQMLVQTQWEPLVPNVKINLYQEGYAADGVTPKLTLVDSTLTSSWDKWAQGFRSDGKPNMNCPGQSTNDLFYFSLYDQANYLDLYQSQHGGTAVTALPYNSQFKCYDGMHNWNQLQPAPYDGMYSFPSIVGRNPTTGVPVGGTGSVAGTNCTICVANPTDGTPMLPMGKYVVEVVPPAGYEIVKEEDKNILIGDNFIAPVTQQFGALSNIFITPDQAQVGSQYNANNAQNSTQSLGASPNNQIVPAFIPEPVWPCVGQSRTVPDYISLFPQSTQVSPFAGATRNLCDRKEVTLSDQMGAIAKFYVYTSTHKASKFTGVITDDFTSEFDPFSPQFGEKFAPANMPIAIRDWTGAEIGRVYSDWWGDYDGLTYSTWEVNPPNPTGYSPTMMVFCMNDKGPLAGGVTDPLFNPAYSQFCYELPYMPGQTAYLDTPVVPTSAFSAGYNHPDCSYPDATPAILSVAGDVAGPWVASAASGPVTSVTLTAGGSYTSTPTVHFAGGGGSGAAATSVWSSSVASVAISNGGNGYTSAPTVSFTGGGGSGATATAAISNGSIISITVTSGGSGYTSAPSVLITGGGGRRATASSTLLAAPVTALYLTADGSGYTSAPTVTFTGAGGGAAATAAIRAGLATLTINGLGDQMVQNNAYSGPSATSAPFNTQTTKRHFGFGATAGKVTIGGVSATVNSWSDTQIVVAVPSSVPNCAVQQQAQYGGSTAQCGQLVITAANGKQSVDTVTVTIGGKTPTLVSGNTGLTPSGTGSIQKAIDAAAPGDLIIVPPGTYKEMLLMWKPVRLQGVGAASSIIDGNTQPAGKMNPWRAEVGCLFGLALNGQPINNPVAGQNGGPATANPYDPSGAYSCPGTGWNYFTGSVLSATNVGSGLQDPQVDRMPLEGILGWDTSVNGNLAELLQEPTLMGAYEGADVTIVAKGVNIHGAPGYYGAGTSESVYPTGTTVLTASDCTTGSGGRNPYPSNFQCNPSSIDGLTLTDSSQGGGGIFAHGWAHNLQIANNRVYSNIGTLSGGVNIGQGEFPDAYLAGGTADSDPGSCETSNVTNLQLPYCFNTHVSVHNNAITDNASIGDELFSGTPAGAGGISFTTGSDYYAMKYNWVCGNLSTGDGGGVSHVGFIKNGDIEHNTIIFNQSLNPTIPANGGGIVVMGAPPDGAPPGSTPGTECGSVTDNDCPPGESDGTGPGLTINANLILGNGAESGSGGGLRLQAVNGTDLNNVPRRSDLWNSVLVTNNIIANNLSGWDGAGLSLEDAVSVKVINNTIISNDSTATAGVLFNTLGAPLASSQTPPSNQTNATGNMSLPQPAGIVATMHSPQFTSGIALVPSTTPLVCPSYNPKCAAVSIPYLANNVIWQNRTFNIGVSSATSPEYQQNLVTMYNSFTETAIPNQTVTGQCFPTGTGASQYWEIGIRGDSAPNNHSSTYQMSPLYSVLTDVADYPAGNNSGSNPAPVSQYCNGSRTPPEFGKSTFNVPPGISDATVPNPIFSLLPAATVDEGNNWINLTWGPLSLSNPTVAGGAYGNYGGGSPLANYALAPGSPAIDYIPPSSATYAVAPSTDFFGNPRPDARDANIDVGAIEYQVVALPTITSISPSSGLVGTTVNVTITGTNFDGTPTVAVSGTGITVGAVTQVSSTTLTTTFTISGTATLGAHNVSVTAAGGTSGTVTFTVTEPVPTLTSMTYNSASAGNNTPETFTGTNLFGGVLNITGGAGGVTIVNPVVNGTGTAITGTLDASGTALGSYSITVTTPGGTSSPALTFTVSKPGVPTLTSITPATATLGSTVTVTLAGSRFTDTANTINVSGTGVTATVTAVNANHSQITASFVISSATSTAGVHTVSVTTPGGTSNTVNFAVTGAAPTLTSISPNTGLPASSVPVTLTGTNLIGTPTLNISGSGVTAGAITQGGGGTTLTTTLTIANSAAAVGAHTISVTTVSGTTGTVTFTVNAPAPTLTSISPNSGLPATAVPVTLTGTNFTSGTPTIAISGTGVTAGAVTVVSATTLTTTLTIANVSAALGAHNVSVTNVGGTTGNVTFTVNTPAAPTLTSMSFNSARRGNNTPETFVGTNLTGASFNFGTCTGLSVVNPTVNAAGTQITTTLDASGTATLGACAISVTTLGGTSSALTFTVVAPPVPTLTSISPTSGTHGTGAVNVSMTLTGSNFTDNGTTVNVSGTGVTVSNVAVNGSHTSITATFTIAAGTGGVGAHTVTVTTPGGTSAGQTFTVN